MRCDIIFCPRYSEDFQLTQERSIMADKLKVGIIGVGGIARTHMPGWAASAHADLIAGSDISAEVLNKWGENNTAAAAPASTSAYTSWT